MSKILTLAATGIAGVVLGAGIGVAAGDTASVPVERPDAPAAPGDDPSMDMGDMEMGGMEMGGMDMGDMDAMHAAMRDQMPADVAERCDEAHEVMVDDVGSGGVTPEAHEQHHADEQED